MKHNKLNEILEKINSLFPSPGDFAMKASADAFTVLERINAEDLSFFELSATEFQLAYQLSALCSEEQFSKLTSAFKERASLALFKTGWIYCQLHPHEIRAASLFSICCEWVNKHHSSEYQKSLISRTGFPLEQGFRNAVDIMRVNKLSIEAFCESYDIMSDTPFYDELVLSWFSRGERSDFSDYEALFSDLILRADHISLRPAIVNYLLKVPFEEMSSQLYNTIILRVEQEKDGEKLGLSPMFLQKVRRQRFSVLLESWITQDKEKLEAYTSICDRIRRMEKLEGGYMVIDFGYYYVVDCEKWKAYSYAFDPEIYKKLFDLWESKGFPEDFWPGLDEKEIVSAHNVILGISKSGAVILKLSGFDSLYVKDLLRCVR